MTDMPEESGSTGPEPSEMPPRDPGAPSEPSHARAGTTGDERTFALVAHLGGALVSFIAPLVVLLIKGNESPYVARQSKEALNFHITLLIAYTAAALLVFCGVGLLLVPVLMIVQIALPIVAAVKVNEGADYRYPLTLRLIT